MRELAGRWALITGASAGLGAAFATLLAERGVNLVLVARREERLQALAARLRSERGVEVRVFAQDLAAPGGPEALYAAVTGAEIAVDLLINNAGFGLEAPDLSLAWEDLSRMLDLNVGAVMLLTRLFGADMVGRGFGRVLQVSSIAAAQPTPGYAAYAATKAFVLHYSEALNHELSGTGVRVTTLCPGVTDTEFFQVSGQALGRYQRAAMMPARDVAMTGLRAMTRGQASVTPGLLNKISSALVRLLPRPLAAALVSAILRF
ncbi:MAG: SDR family oxidoreductase [Deltaproteobacteria bacterium]|nr:SDR family oxidoreductase [Deltaproteobacteria bacterium]